MATCNDCIHNEVCYLLENYGADPTETGVEYDCYKFKFRSSFMELPCKLGDTVYIIVNLKKGNPSHINEQRCTGIHITEKVFKHRAEKAHRYLVVNSDIGFAQHIPFTEFGKTVFFNREEAEAVFAERRLT